MSGRAWSAEDLAVVRAEYASAGAAALARRLGRTRTAVYQAARTIGVARANRPLTAADGARLRELYGRGMTDAEIALATGFDRHRVGGWRASVGLPVNAVAVLRVRRQNARTQRERLGLTNFRGLRVYGQDRLAARYGLPSGLSTAHVRIALALATGPLTKRQMCAVLGRAWPADGSRRALKSRRNGSIPGDLVNLGLASAVWVYTGGKGNRHKVYSLTPRALDLLASAGKERA